MKKNKIKWSKKYFQAKIGTWNCWSMSNERYHYCKGLQYDILGLTELHNTQAKVQFQHKTWIHSAPAAIDVNDKYKQRTNSGGSNHAISEDGR